MPLLVRRQQGFFLLQILNIYAIDSDWYWLMLIVADWCWFMLIYADWCWLMPIDAYWCCVLLIDAVWCCVMMMLVLIDADWCQLMLIDAEWRWLMLIDSERCQRAHPHPLDVHFLVLEIHLTLSSKWLLTQFLCIGHYAACIQSTQQTKFTQPLDVNKLQPRKTELHMCSSITTSEACNNFDVRAVSLLHWIRFVNFNLEF